MSCRGFVRLRLHGVAQLADRGCYIGGRGHDGLVVPFGEIVLEWRSAAPRQCSLILHMFTFPSVRSQWAGLEMTGDESEALRLTTAS
jgi:hypothetical protein